MPTYDFKCMKCLKVEERSCFVGEVDDQYCKCGEKMVVLFTPVGLNFIAYRERPEVRAWRREKGV